MDEEIKKIWTKIDRIEKSLIDDLKGFYERKIKKLVAELNKLRSVSEDDRKAIEINLNTTNRLLAELKKKEEVATLLNIDINSIHEDVKKNQVAINTFYEDASESKQSIENKIGEFDELFEKIPSINENINSLNEIFLKGEDNDSKITSIHSTIVTRKKEIDKLYYEINGYTDKNEDGEDTFIKGKKSELEESYNSLKTNLTVLSKELIELREKTNEDYINFKIEKENEFILKTNKWDKQYNEIETKIAGLLPDALTAGLSHAYSKKKDDEVAEGDSHSRSFTRAIYGLIIVSVIPFSFSIYSLFNNETLQTVILRLPRLVLSILPLYIPVLWVAYSSNKKKNLSKRLVEEYTHKEVLSKTFEGLSTQITNIADDSISSELRTKLLYNILEVNSENPGKLISDYNKTDHPLIDALDKSVKLANAVEKLAKVPGFSQIVTNLERKSKKILEVQERKANAVLETLDEQEKDDDEAET